MLAKTVKKTDLFLFVSQPLNKLDPKYKNQRCVKDPVCLHSLIT